MKIILNTKQRQSGTSIGKPTWELSPPIHNYSNLKIRKCILPNILYSFDTNNNKIILNNNVGSLPLDKRYTLISQFLTDLNNIVPVISNVSSFVFSFKDAEGVLSITYTSSTPITITANNRLGLPENITLPLATNATFNFPNNFSLINSKIVYVAVGNEFGTSDTRSSLKYGNILAIIPQTGLYGDIITYENSDDDFISIEGSDTLSQVSLEFYDSYGNEVNYRGEDIIVELSLRR